MKKCLFPLVFLFLMTTFSSCLTIYEKYTINKDGSGSFEYIIDMSELYSLLESMAGETDMEGIEKTDINESFREMIPELRTIEGISNAQVKGDTDKYIFGISFDFSDDEALNRAMDLILDDKNSENQKYVEIKRKKFIRFHKTSSDFSKEALLGEDDVSDESIMLGVLEGMKYRIEVNLPRKIKTIETKAEIIREDKNLVVIEANFNSLLEDVEHLKTFVKTK